MDRRRLLRLAGGTLAAGGLAALAGCSSSCPDNDPPTPAERVSVTDDPAGPLAGTPAGAWPTSHGDPGRTGFAAGSLPRTAPTLRWRTDLELPDSDEGSLSTSAPVAAGDTVAVADAERVHALSLRSGEVRWRSERLDVTFNDALYEYHANTAAPALGPDGTVFVGTETGLVAVDPDDGAVRWRVDDLDAVAEPAVVDGTVYALGAGSMVAVDRAGEERWRRPVSRGDEPVPPAATPDVVVAVTGDGLLALDPASGDERWTGRRRPETYPVVEDGTCFVGGYDGLSALEAATGEEQWTFDRGGGRSIRSPVLTDETIYVVEQPGEAGAASFALDRTAGAPEPRWCSAIGSGAVAAATDDLALAILRLGEGPDAGQAVVAFTASLGASPWALVGGSNPRRWVTPPAVVDGTVVATTRGGRVVALGGPG